MTVVNFSTKEIWDLLENVKDPEIPVLTIVDLGIVRNIEKKDNGIVVTITPTYSGCPAMKVIEEEIIEILRINKYNKVEIKTTLSPAWTTDWLSEKGRKSLFDYGIAPPAESTTDKSFLTNLPKILQCPFCKSKKTMMVSQFGSTACKALYKCNDCLEPFDYFKCI
jgi:ring-1,2-phenylacetyl-CoA epoxidase subunit PaaD